jgi:hypothetical protein
VQLVQLRLEVDQTPAEFVAFLQRTAGVERPGNDVSLAVQDWAVDAALGGKTRYRAARSNVYGSGTGDTRAIGYAAHRGGLLPSDERDALRSLQLVTLSLSSC